MKTSSGLKEIDKLISKYGIICSAKISNPFQTSIVIPPCLDRISLSNSLLPLGLNNFPPAIWLTLINNCIDKETTLHKFTLNAKGDLSWILMSSKSEVLKIATSNNRTDYAVATRFIKDSLRKNNRNMDMFKQIATK